MRKALIDQLNQLKYSHSFLYEVFYWIDVDWLAECIKKFPAPSLAPIDNKYLEFYLDYKRIKNEYYCLSFDYLSKIKPY